MADDPQRSLDNRVERLEGRQEDCLQRLGRLDELVTSVRRHQEIRRWEVDALDKKTTRLEGYIERVEKRVVEGNGNVRSSSESQLMRVVIYGLLAAVIGLATGQFLNFAGLLK